MKHIADYVGSVNAAFATIKADQAAIKTRLDSLQQQITVLSQSDTVTDADRQALEALAAEAGLIAAAQDDLAGKVQAPPPPAASIALTGEAQSGPNPSSSGTTA